ncbi:MAG: hypothetical protein UCI02_00425 [Bifidobacterium criceti]|nr:hypothetical protein [Bifidobacterium criceti]
MGAAKKAKKKITTWIGAIAGLVVGGVIVAILCGVVPGIPSVFSSSSRSADTQVIHAMEQTKEVSLLRLGITGIKSKENKSHFFNMEIPGTERAQFIQYSFDAKLGFDGKQVVIEPAGEGTYDVTIPEFKFIGYDHPEYRTVVDQNGALSFGTPQIDTANMINEILSEKAQHEYVEKNRDILEDQAKSFYTSIVASVNPDAKLNFSFAKAS